MSKPTTTRNKSRSTATSAATATGVQEDVVVTTSTTSDPSGLRAPDGTNSTDTPQSSGDAAGDASANPVKPQVNSDDTGTALVPAENQTLTPEVEASASGTNSEVSQGAAEGTGANAGPDQADPLIADILETVALLGASDVLRYIELGQRLSNIAFLNGMDEGELAARLRLVEDGSGAEDLETAMARPSSGTIRIKSQRDGFRRAGIVHSTSWRTFGDGELSVKQLATLIDDPLITVELL